MRRLALLLTLLFATLPGCMAYPNVPVDRAAEILQPGDRVRVQLRDERQLEFDLLEVKDGMLIGAEQSVSLGQVRRLYRRDPERGLQSAFLIGFFIVVGAAGTFAL